MDTIKRDKLEHKLSKGALKGVLIAAMAVIFAVGVVAAVLSRSSLLINTFTPGRVTVEVVEPGVDPDSVEWGADTKPVSLQIPAGGSTIPGVVRVMLSPYAYTPDGDGTKALFPGMARPTQNKLVMGDITLHFDPSWTDNWFYKDGYFYYNRVLNPGETTPLLLTGVTLTDGGAAMQAKYEALQVDVEVHADALQAGGGAPAEWGLTVNGNNVSA